MSRSRRGVARRRKRQLANPPQRYINGEPIPPELMELVPEQAAISYLNGRATLDPVAFALFGSEPTVRQLALVTDVLGGVHDFRVYEEHQDLTLHQVARLEHATFRSYPLPLGMIYIERGTGLPQDAEARWDDLQRQHCNSPFLVDVLVVSPDDHLIWSYAQRFGPDPWSLETAARSRIDVQAAEIRSTLGRDDV
jgi:hypothetical protein